MTGGPKTLDRRGPVLYDHAHLRRDRGPTLSVQRMEVTTMTWETPEFAEIRMDAEINSYQDEFDREQDDRF